ncbi:cupin domain-containing protein [Phyllobacterium salinisoli]|uniref:Cupin domain-containing protein n=1 Tax=Phyllobacterium salinisoli TaxID=1899321 RepID=A0A368JYY9_9HYPH|nr:cupin domain-containing protein [Phyllobacterium salinisoli]RCS22376.1 cupin domain-containing protein [Phyllobacterium salinisoli]
MTLTPETIRKELAMQPHPEGGWYVETFRDNETSNGRKIGERGHSTAIYFLLEAGEVSAWHRVRDAAEVWHWHGGSPLELKLSDGSTSRTVRLGLDLQNGQRPQGVVPAGWWQTAKSLGAWTLVGCTVAPGFDFAQFEMAEPGALPE